MKTYFTHDNGSRPYKVTVQNNCMVSLSRTGDYDDEDYGKVYHECFSVKCKRVFIGKSPLNEMTRFSGGHGSKFDGNSFLLKLSENRYLYIGESVKGFEARNEIIRYVSPVGNNDVPYPYAVDKNGLVYLIIEGVILTQTPPKLDDPYRYYYNKGLITEDIGSIPPQQPLIKNFDGIAKYYIGNEPYTLRYHPMGAQYFDDVSKRIKGKQYIVDVHHKKQMLDRQMYARLMKRFGAVAGFTNLRIKTFVERDVACHLKGMSRLRRFARLIN